MNTARKRLTIDIDEALHRRLKARAALEGETVREICVRAIEREVEAGGQARQGTFTKESLDRLDALRREVFGDRILPGSSVDILREVREERSRQSDQW